MRETGAACLPLPAPTELPPLALLRLAIACASIPSTLPCSACSHYSPYSIPHVHEACTHAHAHLLPCRYRLNCSIFLGQVTRSLKWAEGAVVRAELEAQVRGVPWAP